MSDALREIADLLPLALANQAIREPWLGIGNATGALLTTAAIAVVATGARRPAHGTVRQPSTTPSARDP